MGLPELDVFLTPASQVTVQSVKLHFANIMVTILYHLLFSINIVIYLYNRIS